MDHADRTQQSPAPFLRVLVLGSDRESTWSLGELVEWRWVDEIAHHWEGRVRHGTHRQPVWVPGDQIRSASKKSGG